VSRSVTNNSRQRQYKNTTSAPCDFLFKCAVYKYTYLLTYLLTVVNDSWNIATEWVYWLLTGQVVSWVWSVLMMFTLRRWPLVSYKNMIIIFYLPSGHYTHSSPPLQQPWSVSESYPLDKSSLFLCLTFYQNVEVNTEFARFDGILLSA